MSWMVRGPALGIPAASAASGGQGSPVRDGLSTLRYAVAPLVAGGTSRPKPPSKPLWRRILARGLRRKPKENG